MAGVAGAGAAPKAGGGAAGPGAPEEEAPIFPRGADGGALPGVRGEQPRAPVRRRCCTAQRLAVAALVSLELAALVASIAVLAARGGETGRVRTGAAFRCDIAAIAFGLATTLGVMAAVCSDAVTSQLQPVGRRQFPWAWWRTLARFYLQANVCAMGALVLLEHSALALLQLLVTAASACWTLGCCSFTAWAWHKTVPSRHSARSAPPLLPWLRRRRPLVLFALWAPLTGLAYGVLHSKPLEKLPLSSEIGLGEHFVLFYIGGTIISGALTIFALVTTSEGRVLLREREERPESVVSILLRSVTLSVACHLLAALCLMAFFVWIIILLVLLMASFALRASRPPKQQKKKEPPEGCVARWRRRLRRGWEEVKKASADFLARCPEGVRNLPIFRPRVEKEASESEDEAGKSEGCLSKCKGSLKKALCCGGGDAIVDKKTERKRARRKQLKATLTKTLTTLAIVLIALGKTGAIFAAFIFELKFVAKNMERESSSCSARAAATSGNSTDGTSWEVRRRLRHIPEEWHSMAWANGGRALAEASAFGPTSPKLLGPGFRTALEDIGFGRVAVALGDALQWLLDFFEWVVSKELFVPSGVSLRCTATRRLASSVTVLGCVLIVLIVSLMDILSILEASKEIGKARAASSGNFLRYATLVATVQALAFVCLEMLNLTVGSAARLKFEAVGYFQPGCGYLVNADHLDGWQCPNPWNLPVDFLAGILLFAGLGLALMIFVATLSGTFYGMSTSRWATRTFFGEDLKIPDFSEQRTPSIKIVPDRAPCISYAARPVLGLAVTFGMWFSWSSKMFACGQRQNWYEPVQPPTEKKETQEESEGSAENEENEEAHSRFVSWKAMYTATAKSVALMWIPMPIFGPFLGKITKHMNEHVLFAIGDDAEGEDEEAEPILSHFLQDKSRFAQAVSWISKSMEVTILVIIEFDILEHMDMQQRLRALGALVLVVLVIAACRMFSDILQQFRLFKSTQGLPPVVGEVLEELIPKQIIDARGTPDDPLADLPHRDREFVARACRDLLLLSWVCGGDFPDVQRQQLMTDKFRLSARSKIAVFACREYEAQENMATKIVAGSKSTASSKTTKTVDEPSEFRVTKALRDAAVLLALRESVEADIVCRQARAKAKQRAGELAYKAVQERCSELDQWAKAAARKQALEEARRRADEFKRRREYGHSESQEERRVKITLDVKTYGTARVTAQMNGLRILDAPRQFTGAAEAQATATLSWPEGGEPEASAVQLSGWHRADIAWSGAQPVEARRSTGVKRDADGGGDDAAEDEVAGLKDLEERMYERRTCADCRKEPAYTYVLSDGVYSPPQEKFDLEELGVSWGQDGTNDKRNSGDDICESNLCSNRQVFPELRDWHPGDEKTNAELVSELQAAIRSSKYSSKTLLHVGMFLSGVNREKRLECAGLAAARARQLGICKRVLEWREQRRRDADEVRLEAPRRGETVINIGPASVASEEAVLDEEEPGPLDRRIEALERLREAMRREEVSLDELSLCLDAARRVDVDPGVLARAEEMFINMKAREQAALDLANAYETGLIRDLRDAISKARSVGVVSVDFADASGQGLLKKAMAKLDAAEDSVFADLRTAIDAGSVPKLQRALAQAQEADVDDDRSLVQEAEVKLAAVQTKMRRIGLLKQALDSSDATLLRACIAECEFEDTSGEVNLEMAKQRLAALERAAASEEALEEAEASAGSAASTGSAAGVAASSSSKPSPRKAWRAQGEKFTQVATSAGQRAKTIKALRAVLFQEPVQPELLELAVKQAEASGLASDPDLLRARKLLETEREKAAAVKKVREAANQRDMKALRSATAQCHQLGVNPSKLLQFITQLLEEQAKVAQLAGDHGLGNIALAEVERERRDLHNRVQVLKGGLRAVARIRPAAKPSVVLPEPQDGGVASLPGAVDSSAGFGAAAQDLPALVRMDRHTLAVSRVSARTNLPSGKDDTFRFSAVYGPDSIQSEVCAEMDGLVQSAVDGYNVLILACGPRGGGKTHTIFGGGADRGGMAGRVADELFAIRDRDAWRAKLEVDLQMVEVVDATHMADLIYSRRRGQTPAGSRPATGGEPGPSVRVMPTGTASAASVVALEGVMTRRVSQKEELRDLLQDGIAIASREGPHNHVLSLISLTRTNIATGATTKSKIIVADLAGMGRQASRDVARSYKALEDVLRAVAANQQRVPFRDHALTQVLQDCMGGSAKMLLVLALPPERSEQLDTLQAIGLASCGSW